MYYKKCFFLLSFLIIWLFVFNAGAQNKTIVNDILNKVENYHYKLPSEKLYIKTDKPYYFAGDTLWFKAYLVNAGNKHSSYLSNKIYIELLNDSSRVVDRLIIPLQNGQGDGDFKLLGGLTDGAYTLRAYTNWMKNFGEDAFFHKYFYIGNGGNNSWLISEQHTIKPTADGKEILLTLKLNDTKNNPLLYKDMQLQLISGTKTLYKKAFTTSDQGTITTKLTLSENADTKNLKMVLQDINKHMQSFPFYPEVDAQNIDIQFMPEGGELVAGLLNKIAFKAIGNNGVGLAVSGAIVDSKGNEVCVFKSAHNGMGNFRITPANNEIYRAKLKYGSNIKTVTLPSLKTNGIVLRVDNVSNIDTVKVYISTAESINLANKTYTLLTQAKDTVYFGLAFNLTSKFYNLNIPKSRFATGIVNFTILDNMGKPINERKIFINHYDNLNFTTVSNKLTYNLKDSVAINITVRKSDGSPVKNGSFAVAVTDDSQIKSPIYAPTILTDILLTSELKGKIEEPGWYFANRNTDTENALDDLMLTQGWTGFNWNNMLPAATEPKYFAETSNKISGTLTRAFNKPASDANVTLMLSNNESIMIMDTVSDIRGRFVFDNIPYIDSVAYMIKANNKNGSKFNGLIDVNEITPAISTYLYNYNLTPWYLDTDSTLLKYYKNNIANKQTANKPEDAIQGNLLNEVKIKGRRLTSLKGNDGEDIIFYDVLIDEKQLSKGGKLTLLDYLNANVKGFKTKTINRNNFFSFSAYIMLWIIIDDVNVREHYNHINNIPNNHYNFLKTYLTSLKATDVKQLVIYHVPVPKTTQHIAYLVIKTQSGRGPSNYSSSDVYVYRPDTIYKARQFYKPRYTINNNYDLVINRPTIHWDPNLRTDENGNITLSFFAADKPSTYTINIEGSDMLGQFGVQTLKIKVNNGSPVN